MAEFKSGFVSICGRTNVGKSTLINLLVGEKIAAIANKVQTTRTQIRGIVNRENSQIIFIDTPGIHKPKTKLNENMIELSWDAISNSDVILFLIEADSKEIGRGDMKILEKIREANKKSILIINKVDLINKEEYCVNSIHSMIAPKENVEKYAKISAVSYDDLVECFELANKKFIMGIKWHPELMLEDEFSNKLFKEFVSKCNNEHI